MVNRMLLRKLLRDVLQRKGALLTLCIIVAIGVGCYISMASVYRDLSGSQKRYYQNYRFADFVVDVKRAPAWAVEEVASLPNVRAARGRVSFETLIDLPTREEPISGLAISMPETSSPVLNDILLYSGTWFSKGDHKEVILNDAFARKNGLSPGSRIKVLLLDKQHDLLVVGTAMSPEFVYLIPPGGVEVAPDPAQFGVMYLPEQFLQESCEMDGAFNQIIGVAYDSSRPALTATLGLIEEKLDAYGVIGTTVAEDQPSARYLADELKGLRITSTVMPTIFLIVAVLVLNVLMSRMVAQQRTIIGTLKALGYTSGSITAHYIGYGIFVGLIGGLGGVAFGYWAQDELVKLYRQFFALPDIQPHFYLHVLLLGMTISIVSAAIGTLLGARRAARLEPAVAMRPPPPEKGGKVLPERIEGFWRPLPFRWKMIVRAIFRNPFRSSVNMLASLVATALIFAALSMTDSLDYLMNYEFKKVAHQDISISLRDPEGITAPREVSLLPTVTETEPQLVVPCDLQNGPYQKRIGVMGLVHGNHLYTPLDKQGNPIAIPGLGLILSKKLAEILNLAPGDTVRLRSLIGLREEVVAPIVGTVETFLGLSAYANIRYLSKLIGEEWAANVILCDTFQGKAVHSFLDPLKARPTVIGVKERTRALIQLNETFGKTMGTMMFIMVLFAGLVAFGSVFNTALVSLSERQREVGTLRVLGYSPTQITGIFSGESLMLNGAGILMGLAFGILLAHGLSLAYSTELYRFPAVIYPWRLAMCAVIMGIFVSAAQLIIHRLICKLKWLEVVKIME
jgi:putative ABC transport system permease protein